MRLTNTLVRAIEHSLRSRPIVLRGRHVMRSLIPFGQRSRKFFGANRNRGSRKTADLNSDGSRASPQALKYFFIVRRVMTHFVRDSLHLHDPDRSIRLSHDSSAITRMRFSVATGYWRLVLHS